MVEIFVYFVLQSIIRKFNYKCARGSNLYENLKVQNIKLDVVSYSCMHGSNWNASKVMIRLNNTTNISLQNPDMGYVVKCYLDLKV